MNTIEISGILSALAMWERRFGYNRFYQFFETSDCPGSANGQPDYAVPFGYGTSKPI
jgi:hypothetical protein